MIEKFLQAGDKATAQSLRDAMLRAIGTSRFALYHHVVRRRAEIDLDADYPDAFSQDLGDRWADRLGAKQLFVNDLYLTLVRRPLQGRIGLADQVRKSGITATAVQVDTSLFIGPDMAPGWDPADIWGGDIAPIQSVMLDAGRIQPSTLESRRSATPALDAGRALAGALGINPARVTFAPGPAGGSTRSSGHGARPSRPRTSARSKATRGGRRDNLCKAPVSSTSGFCRRASCARRSARCTSCAS